MRTLRTISNRKLDKLQDRISDAYWNTVDVPPGKIDTQKLLMVGRKINRIAEERLRRLRRA